MSNRSRQHFLHSIVPPPLSKAFGAIIVGAAVITAVLYFSGAAEYVFGQVYRPGTRRHDDCNVNDARCRQAQAQRRETMNRKLLDPLSNYASLGVCQPLDTRCLEELRRNYHATGSLYVTGQSASRPRPNQQSANQRTVYAGQTQIINVPGRYEFTTIYRIYPRAIRFCQTAGFQSYIQSKISAWLPTRVRPVSEWRNIVTGPNQGSVPSSPTPRAGVLPRLPVFPSSPVPTLVVDTFSNSVAPTSPPRSPAPLPSVDPNSLMNDFLTDGATVAPPYTPPVPFGTRTPNGCWYFPPDPSLRGIHSFTIPTDVTLGRATISIVEGMLQPNRVAEQEVKNSLRDQLGRRPTYDEVQAALRGRPDRYNERLSDDYTVESVNIGVASAP